MTLLIPTALLMHKAYKKVERSKQLDQQTPYEKVESHILERMNELEIRWGSDKLEIEQSREHLQYQAEDSAQMPREYKQLSLRKLEAQLGKIKEYKKNANTLFNNMREYAEQYASLSSDVKEFLQTFYDRADKLGIDYGTRIPHGQTYQDALPELFEILAQSGPPSGSIAKQLVIVMVNGVKNDVDFDFTHERQINSEVAYDRNIASIKKYRGFAEEIYTGLEAARAQNLLSRDDMKQYKAIYDYTYDVRHGQAKMLMDALQENIKPSYTNKIHPLDKAPSVSGHVDRLQRGNDVEHMR